MLDKVTNWVYDAPLKDLKVVQSLIADQLVVRHTDSEMLSLYKEEFDMLYLNVDANVVLTELDYLQNRLDSGSIERCHYLRLWVKHNK